MLNTEQQIELAAKLLRLSVEDARKYHYVVEGDNLVYVGVPVKGGEAIIVGTDGTVLYANSSISYERHLEEFRRGTRTPIEAFGDEQPE